MALTNSDFAQQCAYIAKTAASAAAGVLANSDHRDRPIDPHTAERFCRDMEGWISHIRSAAQGNKNDA